MAGEHDVAGFLKAADWSGVWGFAKELYLPLFHFARQNRIPMVALNVERSMISKVGREGWAALSAEEREGVSDPAPASQAYRESLARVFGQKAMRRAPKAAEGEGEGEGHGHGEAPELAEILEREDFGHFVEAQLAWDRAMAEALVAAGQAHPGAQLVGILGLGHIEHGHGVPHQLNDLGLPGSAVLIPVEAEAACDELAEDLADAVFVVAAAEAIEPARPRARLGVVIEKGEAGVRILRVMEDSVAETTELAAGDLILMAAGFPVEEVSGLVEIIQRQAPGTWLPLRIRRGEEEMDVVARFSTEFGASE